MGVQVAVLLGIVERQQSAEALANEVLDGAEADVAAYLGAQPPSLACQARTAIFHLVGGLLASTWTVELGTPSRKVLLNPARTTLMDPHCTVIPSPLPSWTPTARKLAGLPAGPHGKHGYVATLGSPDPRHVGALAVMSWRVSLHSGRAPVPYFSCCHVICPSCWLGATARLWIELHVVHSEVHVVH